MRTIIHCYLAAATAIIATPALAQDADALAKQTSNPISSLVSVPFQNNLDFGGGIGGNGVLDSLRFQPVIPFELNADWNVISRTVVPFTYAQDIFPGGTVTSTGDTEESLFFSPTNSGVEGLTIGAGPILLFPTASDDRLATGKWGVGPTGVIVYQTGPWTMGALANQIWSVAGDPTKPDVNQTFLQPFVSYALGGGQTISANLEASYDWTASQWSVPANLTYSKVFSIGTQPMSFQIGARKYLATTPTGPDWGIRSGLTFLFPSK